MATATAPESFTALPLREQKAARTRHALITAAIKRMRTRPYSEVRVTDLCREVPISEPTFFKHFSTKGHVLVHLKLLMGIGVEWRVQKVERRSGPKRAIEAIFDEFGESMSQQPHVAHELLSHQAARRHPPRFPEISPGDRILWYPDRPGIEDIQEVGIIGVLTPRIEACRKASVIPRSVSTETATTALLSVFMGVPMTWLWKKPKAVPQKYREQLRITWKGLGVRVPRTAKK